MISDFIMQLLLPFAARWGASQPFGAYARDAAQLAGKGYLMSSLRSCTHFGGDFFNNVCLSSRATAPRHQPRPSLAKVHPVLVSQGAARVEQMCHVRLSYDMTVQVLVLHRGASPSSLRELVGQLETRIVRGSSKNCEPSAFAGRLIIRWGATLDANTSDHIGVWQSSRRGPGRCDWFIMRWWT